MATRRKSLRALRLGGLRGLDPRYVEFLRAFITHYQETHVWNAAAAARAAGYAPEHARIEGHRILALPAVYEVWQNYLERENVLAEIDPTTQVIEHRQNVDAIAHFELADVVEYDGNQVRVRPTEQWSARARKAVKLIRQKEVVKTYEDGLTETTRTIEIEAHDKVAALRLEAQELGTMKSGSLMMRLPGGQEIESEGGIFVYQVNRFEIPDNGRGPTALPIGAAQDS